MMSHRIVLLQLVGFFVSFVWSSSNCFQKNVIYRGSHMGPATATSADECQSTCAAALECQYFTYSENTLQPLGTCSLFYSVEFSTSATFTQFGTTFTSGPADCSSTLPAVEDSVPELSIGCGGSSPTVCEYMNVPNYLTTAYEASCGTNSSQSGCGFGAMPCCRACGSTEAIGCPYENCYQAGYISSGGSVVNTLSSGVQSPFDCQTACLKTSGCDVWSYMKPSAVGWWISGECSMVSNSSGDVTYEVSTPMMGVAGPANCPVVPVISDTTTTSTAEPGFTDEPGSTDDVLSTAEGSTSSSTSTTYPTCLEDNMDYYGDDVSNVTDIGSASDCQAECQAVAACLYFTYIPATSLCWLKFSDINRVAVPTHVSGPKTCEPGWTPTVCFVADQDYQYNDVTSINNVYSPEECQTQCTLQRVCEAFTYASDTNVCYLKIYKGTVVPAGNRVSGPQFCPGSDATPPANQSRCFVPNMDYQGGDLPLPYSPVANVSSVQDCQNQCAMTEGCNFFTYSPFIMTCFLKSTKANQITINHVVSGPSSCDCNNATCSTGGGYGTISASETTSTFWKFGGVSLDWAGVFQKIGVVFKGSDGCIVSDIQQGENTTCWDLANDYFPMSIRMQVVAVAEGSNFTGWNNYMAITTPPDYTDQTEFVVLDKAQTINSYLHGYYYEYLGYTPTSWPPNWTSPKNFNQFEFRYVVDSYPTTDPAQFEFCLWGMTWNNEINGFPQECQSAMTLIPESW